MSVANAMSKSTSPSLEMLLEHADWIRALARRLVRDPDTAEEVVQRTFLAAADRNPGDDRPVRAWLAVVVRNLARAARRASARRSHHESKAARPEALPSVDDVVGRAQMQRELVEAVLELDEPYRKVILLRFYDGKTPNEIARALGLPAATVRTHLARGIAKLRARLDRAHGGNRESWLSVLLPLAHREGLIPDVLSKTILVNAKIQIITAAAGALVVLLAIFQFTKDADESDTAAAPPSSAARAPLSSNAGSTSAPSGIADPGSTEVRASASASVKVSEAAAPVPPPVRILRGRVVEASGASLSNVLIHFRDNQGSSTREAGTSDAGGRFEMEAPKTNGRFTADGASLATVLEGVYEGNAGVETVIVAARRLALQGTVVDGSGTPLAGVNVRVELPESFRTRLRVNLDHSAEVVREIESNEQGRYELPVIAMVEGSKLHATRAGYDPFAIALEEIPGPSFTIILRRPGEQAEVLRGRVLDASGVPVEGARVSLGIELTTSDDAGNFQVRLADRDGVNARFGVQATRLRAVKPGFLPAELQAALVDGKTRWPAEITLRLGAKPLSISGRVIDHDEKRRAGIRVWIADPTMLGADERGLVQVESFLAGSEKPWHYVKTDENGEFTIDGLMDREYVVRAMEHDTLLRTEEKNVRGGTAAIELRMPTDELYLRVAGRVIGHDGKGIAGVKIGPMCDAFQVRLAGQVMGTSHHRVKGTVTDAEGRFELVDVPKSLVYLRLDSDDTLPLEYGRYVEGDDRFTKTLVRELPRERITALEITVDRRAHVQVELSDPTTADEFSLLDAAGDEIELSVFVGNGRREGKTAPIHDGRSHVVSGSDRARTLVLYKAQLEVTRIPVQLAPGETKTVRF